jgi:hypothetical protein
MTKELTSFTCPKCGMTSFNPNDLREGYCGNCHDWTAPRHTEPVIDTGCDECGAPAVFVAYASYEVNPAATHALLARYPMPMIRSCAEHIGGQLLADTAAFGATRTWVVNCA